MRNSFLWERGPRQIYPLGTACTREEGTARAGRAGWADGPFQQVCLPGRRD